MVDERLSTDGAVVVDDTLASLFCNRPNPTERLSTNQSLAFFLDSISGGGTRKGLARLVQLECHHFKITTAHKRTGCPRCGAMIRAGYDYDAFRNLNQPDDFKWRQDPLKTLHERD